MTADIGGGVHMVRRSEWGARPPRSQTTLRPTFGTTLHWEGPHMGAFDHSQCAAKVRVIQNFHMDNPDRRWSDIAYTALVCPHGWVFEGRWIGVRTAANGTTAGNNQAYAVCYLGGVGDLFTEAGKRAYNAVIFFLRVFGAAGSGVNCHRDWKPTQCPGDEICGWVRAGRPVAPPPPQPPPDLGDDNMVIIRNGNSARYAMGGKLVVCTGETTATNAREAGVPVFFVDDDDWDRLHRAYPVVQ
jgi:hypothetical protein